MTTTLDELRALSRLLDENQPPPLELYVPAIRAKRDVIVSTDIDDAIRDLREFLAGGLVTEGYNVLDRVDRTHELSKDEESARLFRDGRILAHPPTADGERPSTAPAACPRSRRTPPRCSCRRASCAAMRSRGWPKPAA